MHNARRAELAKIHIGAKQLKHLGFDPADKDPHSEYRNMLFSVAGKRSSSKLNERERHDVIKHLTKCGAVFTPPKRSGKRPHNFNQLPEYITKVEALLADMGLSWAYADTIARNISGGNGTPNKDPGVEKLAWVKNNKHWIAIITALSIEQEKRALLAQVESLLQQTGRDKSHIENNMPNVPKNWQRNRRCLKAIIQTLIEAINSEA